MHAERSQRMNMAENGTPLI